MTPLQLHTVNLNIISITGTYHIKKIIKITGIYNSKKFITNTTLL